MSATSSFHQGWSSGVTNAQLFPTNLVELVYLHSLPYLDCGSIRDEEAAADAFRSFWSPGKLSLCEEFMMMTLTSKNRVTSMSKIAVGTTVSVNVDLKTIAATAVLVPATSGILIAHNHPSGSLTPSQSDLALTERVGKAMKLFGVRLLDHLILTEKDHYSMASGGEFASLSFE